MRDLLVDINAWRSVPLTGVRIRFMLLLLFSFSLPFERTYSSVFLGVWVVASLLDFNALKKLSLPGNWWVFLIIYFLSLTGYFYSLHKNVASFVLERQAALVLIPLLLPLSFDGDRRRLALLLDALTLGSIAVLTYLFCSLALTARFELGMGLKAILTSGLFFHHKFSQPVSVHAGYLSLYIALSCIHVAYRYQSLTIKMHKVLAWLILVYLAAGLFMLASRNAIISLIVIVAIIMPLFRAKNKLKYFLVAIAIASVLASVAYQVPYLRERFMVEMLGDISSVNNEQLKDYNAAEPRYKRWDGAFRLIGRSPLFGYGTGDEVAMLKTEYIKDGLYISYLEEFNAHNQYLSIILKHGLPGFLAFAFALFFFCRLAWRSGDVMYSSFLLLLLIGFYTENILDANKGIFFFGFFNTLFAYTCIWRREALHSPPGAGPARN